jgi:hypothetical protein
VSFVCRPARARCVSVKPWPPRSIASWLQRPQAGSVADAGVVIIDGDAAVLELSLRDGAELVPAGLVLELRAVNSAARAIVLTAPTATADSNQALERGGDAVLNPSTPISMLSSAASNADVRTAS